MSRFLQLALVALLMVLKLVPAHAADDFLDPEQAFQLSVKAVDAKTVEAAWTIAPGYYMYREQFKTGAEGATLGEPVLAKGETKFDETFQKEVEIYHDKFVVSLPVATAKGPFKLTLVGQGCAAKGLCYPPMTTLWQLDLAKGTATKLDMPDPLASPAATAEPAAVATPAPAAESGSIAATLAGGQLLPVIGLFLLLGLGLSLTPCVLPMLPILSSIIVGSGAPSRARGLLLAISYSLGMAIVYTLLGVAAALAGEGLAGALQKPWVLTLFAAALVIFSLSMFGAYELQLPSGLSSGLTGISQRLPGGKLAGVFVMGGVSALIVSPCVTGPLAGALVYISQTRNVLLGGSALFALAAGMSVPLLLLGASAGTLLPRAGAWMDGVKHFFGMLLLAVAIYMVQPVLPVAIAQLLWGALLIGAAAMFGLFETSPIAGQPLAWLRKALAVIALVWGAAQLIGAAQGGTDPLKPLGSFATASREAGPAAANAELRWQPVRSVAELDAAIAAAGKPVMLDFYADWCVSCKEMDRDTFSDAKVRERLSHALLLRADVTANSPDDRALLKRFQLFGPPGTIFFDPRGQELPHRVVGFENVETFAASLSSVGL